VAGEIYRQGEGGPKAQGARWLEESIDRAREGYRRRAQGREGYRRKAQGARWLEKPSTGQKA
jgi:hypothetical protein